MTTGRASDPEGRGSRELWLRADYDILVESGIDDVRIQAHSRRFEVSRTSFYWFFSDREALLDALLCRWCETNSGSLLKSAPGDAESITDPLAAVSVRFGFDPIAADARTRTIDLTRIGSISMTSREGLSIRTGRIPHDVEIFTEVAAKPHELARVQARHSFVDPRRSSGTRAA